MKRIIGKTITEVIGLYEDSREVRILFTDGSWCRLYHYQDCCESVSLNELEKPDDLIGASIVDAYVESNAEYRTPDYADSFTWTFYRIITDRGTIFMRWLGESNGYYSEEVNFEFNEVKDE